MLRSPMLLLVGPFFRWICFYWGFQFFFARSRLFLVGLRAKAQREQKVDGDAKGMVEGCRLCVVRDGEEVALSTGKCLIDLGKHPRSG